MSEITVLVVDDEPAVRETLRSGLIMEGWTVLEAWDRETLFEQLRDHEVDVVTLDLNLGEEDGLGIAVDLRNERNIPVLMISGRNQPFDRVQGLESGADDYIVKPFLIREVVLRIRRTLERYRGPVQSPAKLQFDHSELDLEHRVARHLDGTPLELTGMELKLLELFLLHPGRVLTRDEISNALYDRDWSPYDRSIDGHVARLRRKIEVPGDEPMLIRSVRGVGYVFSGDVTRYSG
ncbi:response regulator transcription factor [Histidinibacterium aquaticum]|uniref:Response regulator transcription factor n=1 Tax=Histidinibacterium aquaticum TaxID=2613962 RepID=A0A5J5GEQ8_9RHOB|nr:response regulator transcription factor [Histidinibacterium aquaticum]KAA9006709.1 response regulator transcription factor [Histidinibacterium aquaticum]